MGLRACGDVIPHPGLTRLQLSAGAVARNPVAELRNARRSTPHPARSRACWCDWTASLCDERRACQVEPVLMLS